MAPQNNILQKSSVLYENFIKNSVIYENLVILKIFSIISPQKSQSFNNAKTEKKIRN